MPVLAIISKTKKISFQFLRVGWQGQHFVTAFKRTLPAYRALSRQGTAPRLLLDGDGRHHQPQVKRLFTENRVITIDPWPANSPDLNPIENVFSWMKREVEARGPLSEDELKSAIQEAWYSYPEDSLELLFDTMPARLEEVINNGGGRLKH